MLTASHSSAKAAFKMAGDFYCRYYVGHKGKFGHEFLEFEFRPDGEKYSSDINFSEIPVVL